MQGSIRHSIPLDRVHHHGEVAGKVHQDEEEGTAYRVEADEVVDALVGEEAGGLEDGGAAELEGGLEDVAQLERVQLEPVRGAEQELGLVPVVVVEVVVALAL